MNKLHVIDGAFVPYVGVFEFMHLTEEDVVNAIVDAIDKDFFSNIIRSRNAATKLSLLTGRHIAAGAADRPERGSGDDVKVGDALILCPHLNSTRAERRRRTIEDIWVFCMVLDCHSPQGLADKVVRAKPKDMLYHDWMTKVGEACGAEHRRRIERAERVANAEENGADF